MSWFKVDDTLAFHDKVVAAGNAAMGLWVRAGAWSSQMLTDGVVPHHMVAALGGAESALELVAVGLWVEHPKGYVFHGWDEYQFTRDEVEAKRKYERDRKREQRRNALGQYTGVPTVVPLGRGEDSDGSPTNPSLPVPSQPNPSQSPSDSKAADAEFEAFWTDYPRKVGRGQARRAWTTARKKADPEAITAAMKAQTPQLTAKGEQFCPHAATWLNGERWADEIHQPRPASSDGWWN